MSHISKQQWESYVQFTMSEDERTQCEDHMYACDHCLELYLEVVEQHESQLPSIEQEELFTTMVMKQVGKKQPSGNKKVLFHYLLAAAATLLLMLSGVFSSITSYVDTVQSPVVRQGKSTSITASLMDRTFQWVDQVERKVKEEEK